MDRRRFLFSTIDPNAGELARRFGFGIEIAEYCTAWNMDEQFPEAEDTVRRAVDGIDHRILHGPFNELFPCAIDPKARQLASDRFRQAAALAERYGAEKIVFHGGFLPNVYYPIWYVEQGILFWRELLRGLPGDAVVCIENVLEPEPEMMASIVRAVDSPRLRLCLDIGHANVYSKIPAADWISCWGSLLSHAHIHNNDGSADSHSALDRGTLDTAALIRQIDAVSPQATYTLELPAIGDAPRWLQEKEIVDLWI